MIKMEKEKHHVYFAELDLDASDELAERLSGPHHWVWAVDSLFYCCACHVTFEWGEPIPEGPCDPDPDIRTGQIWTDGIPIDEFIQRHGRTEAERRFSEAGLCLRWNAGPGESNA